MDKERFYKLSYIAKRECHSINGLLLVLARKCIAEFEKQYGIIFEEEIEQE